MSITTIQLEPEQTDAIVIQEMEYHIQSLRENFRQRQNGEIRFGIFDNEIETDLLKLEEHINAFNMVRSYFTAESTQF